MTALTLPSIVSLFSRKAGATELLACLLIFCFAVPDTEASYLVRRTNYVLGLANTEAECGALDPATQCVPGDIQSNATSVSGSVSSGSYSGSASANLSTGKLAIQGSGPTYESTANANLEEQLTFTNIAPGTSRTIRIILNLDGTYRDGSSITANASFQSGDYFSSDWDYLSMDLYYTGNGQTQNSSDPVSGTTFDLTVPCTTDCSIITSGNWTSLGPAQFIGEVVIFGNEPNLVINMALSGTGYFDLGNTYSLSLVLPNGVGFTSSSGVFLSVGNAPDNDGDGIPDSQDDDDDNDGMPDVFELQYGFNPLDDSDADKDADGDGYSNLSEYRAGTDPRDPLSIPRSSFMPWVPLLLD
ncbi:MAG TPA: hypothetical protein VET88_14685 [Gammaproteobacteria bacterium]|nr:hypothetical protein [Gammaproteobacteria bacterium]